MFLKLWNYIRGYVIIKVSGFSVERFMNLAVHKGIYIWDVKPTSDGVFMKVSVKGFKELKACAHKTKCKIKIHEKIGYPFYMHKYRRRKTYVFGIFFFILSLYFLSSFIWLVEVDGNDRLPKETIVKFFEEQGIKVGGFKYSLNKKQIEKEFLNKYEEVSWVNIEMNGTKATIKMTETIPKQNILDRTTPCDIIATKDGLITDIVTSAGTPLKKEKDIVMKGDVIVSGKITATGDNGDLSKLVHANAQVRAKTYYDINFKVPFEYEEKRYTGNIKKYYALKLLDKKIDLHIFKPSISYTSYDKIIMRNQIKISEDYPLPIIIITEYYREFEPIKKKYTIQQAMEQANRMLTSRIIHEFDFEVDIIDKIIEYSEEPDGLQIHAVVTGIERIDKQVAIEDTAQIETVSKED